jgi:3-methyladenine DNA glycosylase AlkD
MKISNPHHKEILDLIISLSGEPTAHTFSDDYLGTSHPRYPINNPTLRQIAKEWMRDHKSLSIKDFESLLTSLIKGKSTTEKLMAGMLMDAATKPQRQINPKVFDTWLDHLEGWAEVDTICTGEFTVTEVPRQWPVWKKLLIDFSKSKNIHKRRASLALLCSPIRRMTDPDVAKTAFQIIQRLKIEKEILITKAVSWLLRSMTVTFKKEVADFVDEHETYLPKIAVRETRVKLLTGRKTARD